MSIKDRRQYHYVSGTSFWYQCRRWCYETRCVCRLL